MDLMQTHTYTPEDIISGDLKIVTEPETIKKNSKVIPKWTLMGRISATGALIASVKTATDGSETPIGILVGDVDATAADTRAPVYKAGMFDPSHVVLDASWTVEDMRLSFEGSGIFFREPIAL